MPADDVPAEERPREEVRGGVPRRKPARRDFPQHAAAPPVTVPAPHGGPGVEPGSDDELDAVTAGPSPTHPHAPPTGTTARTTPAATSAFPRPPPAAVRPSRGAGEPAPRAVGPRRRRRHGLRAHRGRRAVGRLLAGRRARRGSRALRPPLRRRAHRGRAAGHAGCRRAGATRSTRCAARAPCATAWTRPRRRRRRRARAPGSTGSSRRPNRPSGPQRAARDAQRAAAVARKEELAAEAESLAAEATQWKQAGDRFKAILDEWRTDPRHRPQDRRAAVEAVLQGPGGVQPPPRLALRRPRPAARGRQGTARRSWSSRPRSSPTPTTGAPPRPASATS